MKPWPDEVAEKLPGLAAALDRDVETVRNMAIDRYRAEQVDIDGKRIVREPYLNSELREDAERIEVQARDLLAAVKAFHEKAGVRSQLENHRDTALDHIERQWQAAGWEMSDMERTLHRAGMDPNSLQWPLVGLQIQMQVVDDAYRGKSSRSSFLRWSLARMIIHHCAKAGICVDPDKRKQYESLKRIINVAFERVNHHCRKDTPLVDPLRVETVNSIARVYLKLGDSFEFWNTRPKA